MTHENNKNMFVLNDYITGKKITSVDDNIEKDDSIKLWFGKSYFEVYVNNDGHLGMSYFYKPTELQRLITSIKWSIGYYIRRIKYSSLGKKYLRRK